MSGKREVGHSGQMMKLREASSCGQRQGGKEVPGRSQR